MTKDKKQQHKYIARVYYPFGSLRAQKIVHSISERGAKQKILREYGNGHNVVIATPEFARELGWVE
jgi:hypothetical protein